MLKVLEERSVYHENSQHPARSRSHESTRVNDTRFGVVVCTWHTPVVGSSLDSLVREALGRPE